MSPIQPPEQHPEDAKDTEEQQEVIEERAAPPRAGRRRLKPRRVVRVPHEYVPVPPRCRSAFVIVRLRCLVALHFVRRQELVFFCPRVSLKYLSSSSGIRDDNPRQQRDKDQSRAKTQQKRQKQVPPSSFVQSLPQQSRIFSKPFRAAPESRRFSLYAFESIRLPRGVDNRAMNGFFHVS